MSPFNLDDYEPVEDRLRAFWADHPKGRIFTELVEREAGSYIVKASVWREPAADPDATGYATETVTERGVNATSALENCETSAIGRALANLGYAAKGKRPSREEMQKSARRATKGGAADEGSGTPPTEPSPGSAAGGGEAPAAAPPSCPACGSRRVSRKGRTWHCLEGGCKQEWEA